MAYIENKPSKPLTKKQWLALSKRVRKETMQFLSKMRKIEELQKLPNKNPIYFAAGIVC